MARKRSDLPPFRIHKASQNAYVNLDGERRYLGRADDPATKERYDRLIREWLAGGRSLIEKGTELTIVELTDAFWKYAEGYYVTPEGKPGRELPAFRIVLKRLKELYGRTKASEFGPRGLKAIRDKMVDDGWCRRYINQQTGRIKRLFKWAVAEELVNANVWYALQAVSGLKLGRTKAPEPEGVKPVPDATIDATLPFMTPTVRAMVALQRATGMRPGEVVLVRTCDLETGGTTWVYRPAQHKTAYRGRRREVFIGPKGQRALHPFLLHDTRAYVFTPENSERERLAKRHAERKTPASCGNTPGSNRKSRPLKKPGVRYDTLGFKQAVEYACDRAFPPPKGLDAEELKAWRREHRWTPGQIRHTFATEVRREHGLEAAQVLLGHARADVTQVYAERDVAKAVSVALKIG